MTTRTCCQRLGTRGFNLIEAAIVLGIIGLIIGGIWIAAASVTTKKRETDAYTDVVRMVTGLRNIYAGHTLPATPGMIDITSAMISAGIVPSDLVQNGVMVSRWGNNWHALGIYIKSNALGERIFSLFTGDVSRESCITLAVRYSGVSGLSMIEIIDGDSVSTEWEAFPITPDDAQTACAPGDPGAPRSITLEFFQRG